MFAVAALQVRPLTPDRLCLSGAAFCDTAVSWDDGDIFLLLVVWRRWEDPRRPVGVLPEPRRGGNGGT